jgi:hypothetical protein
LGGALIADLDVSNANSSGVNGTGVLIPQTDTSAASFAGSYAFGAQAYHNPRGPALGWEFDFVGQGLVDSGSFSDSTGVVSDPFFIFNATPPEGTDTATFSGTASPDPANAGRYTIKLGVTLAAADPDFNAVIYQANGGQLFWLDEEKNDDSVFLGSLEQQGSLIGLPAAQGTPAQTKSNQKP